jgi:hypothetical protein
MALAVPTSHIAASDCVYMTHNVNVPQTIYGYGHLIMHGNYANTPYSTGKKTQASSWLSYRNFLTQCYQGSCANVDSPYTTQTNVWVQATGSTGSSVLVSNHRELWNGGVDIVCRSAI